MNVRRIDGGTIAIHDDTGGEVERKKIGAKAATPIPQAIYYNALYFYQAAHHINSVSPKEAWVGITAIVNALLSCELFLKCLMLPTINNNDHTLNKLYGAIGKEKQRRVFSYVSGIAENDFTKWIRKHSDDFVRVRYVSQYEALEFDLGNALVFATALKLTCESYNLHQ